MNTYLTLFFARGVSLNIWGDCGMNGVRLEEMYMCRVLWGPKGIATNG